MKRFTGVKGTIILIVLIVGIVAYYGYLSNKTAELKESDSKITAVQNVLLRDMELNYPPTVKEVIKYYSEITRCFYNEEYTEEELYDLAMKAMELYDHDLAANKTEEEYLIDLKSEIQTFKNNGYSISSYSTSSSTDVYDFEEDGFQFARLYCTYNVRMGTVIQPVEEIFLLRMDLEGHWKIYGWDAAENHKGLQNQ